MNHSVKYPTGKLNYTKWQHQYFNATAPGEFDQKALEYAEKIRT